MSISQVQSNQVVYDAALNELATSARDNLLTILPQINASFTIPGKITASGKVITIGNTAVNNPDIRVKSLPLINGVYVGNLSGTYSLQDASVTGQVQTVSLPAMLNGDYIRLGFEVRNDGLIYPIFGIKDVVAANATYPVFSTGIALGVILLHYSSGAFDNVIDSNINQFHSAVPNPAAVAIALYETSTQTNSTSLTLTHGLAGEPQILSFFYYDGTNKTPVDSSSIVVNKTTTELILNTNDFDFASTKALFVTAIKFG